MSAPDPTNLDAVEPAAEGATEQEAQQAAPPRAWECRVCSTRFPTPGDERGKPECPACGADSVEKLDAPGGAVEYVLAKRTHGTTKQDVRLAQWAKWAKFITPHQYDLAIHRQNSEAQEQGYGRPIHEVMESEKMIEPGQSIGLMQFLALPRPNEFDEDFVDRLLRQKDVERSEVRRVQKLQSEMAGPGKCVPPIGQLLLNKGVIDEVTLLEILRQQARNDTGSLSLAMKIRGRRKQAADELQKLRPLARRVGLAAVVLIVLGAIAFAVTYEPPRMVGMLCENCGVTYWGPGPTKKATWPLRCINCGAQELWPGYVCVNGHVFRRQHSQDLRPCPECGSTLAEPLPPEYDYDLVQD
jgi:hypothetical protein